ncbi:MAG: hypothetical protein Q4G40_11875 [Brachybacterium sp.]|nr:hypothetical protein [Brachybacterium sp.]
MDARSHLRDEVTVTASMCVGALTDRPGDHPGEGIAAASHLVDAAERALHLLVGDARGAGMTWAGVGEALGISRQAAQKRFSGQIPQKVIRDRPEAPAELVELAVSLLEDAAEGRFERLDARASAQLQRSANEAGIAPYFASVVPVFGEFIAREEPIVQVFGTVVQVTAREQRTRRPARARVTLTADGTLLGIHYDEDDDPAGDHSSPGEPAADGPGSS